MTPRLVLATANPDKVAEIAALLDGVEMVPRPADLDEVVENGETLSDNARLKARAVSDHTGCAAVADDTGLFVEALGGRPGVHSARFAGDDATYADNVALLLHRLDGVDHRRAEFRTVALVWRPDGTEVAVEGIVTGTIAGEPRGDNGFGYDPVFVPDDGDGRTFAEMTDVEKNAVSHRARAFCALRDVLVLPPPPIATEIVLPVVDMAAAVAFYERLGLAVERHDDGYAWVRHRGEEVLHLCLEPALDVSANRAGGYFHVGDVDRWHAVCRAGGANPSPPEDLPWAMREFRFTDPSGNTIRIGQSL